MKNFPILALVLTLAAPMAFAEEPEASQPAPAPAAEPAPLSRFSLGTYLAYWHVDDLKDFDGEGFIGGGVVGQFRLFDSLSLEMRIGGYGAGISEDVYVPLEGWYENDTTVVSMTFEAGLVASPSPRRAIPHLRRTWRWLCLRWRIHHFPGTLGWTLDLDFDDEPGAYLLFGSSFQLARNAALFLEGKYTWVESSLTVDSIRTSPRLPGIVTVSRDFDFSGFRRPGRPPLHVLGACPMIHHIVMWRLKDSAHGNDKAVNARLIKEKLEALPQIPELRHLEVGLDFSATDCARISSWSARLIPAKLSPSTRPIPPTRPSPSWPPPSPNAVCCPDGIPINYFPSAPKETLLSSQESQRRRTCPPACPLQLGAGGLALRSLAKEGPPACHAIGVDVGVRQRILGNRSFPAQPSLHPSLLISHVSGLSADGAEQASSTERRDPTRK